MSEGIRTPSVGLEDRNAAVDTTPTLLVAGAGFEPAMLLAYETEVVTEPFPH